MPPEYYSELADVLRGRRGIVLGVDGSVVCSGQRCVYHIPSGEVKEIVAPVDMLAGWCQYYEFYSGWVAVAVPMRCAGGSVVFSCEVWGCGRAACPTMRRVIFLQRYCAALYALRKVGLRDAGR